MARTTLVMPTRVPDIRKGDTVIVLGGKDAGKRGTVSRVMRRRGTIYGRHKLPRPGAATLSQAAVVIDGINIAKRHTKPRPSTNQNDRVPQMQQGGIIDIAQPLPLGKVMLVCPRCDKPTRVRHVQLETGERVRVCMHCGEQIEVKP